GDERRKGAGKESTVAVLSAADEYEHTERIPEPAIAEAAHNQHGNSYASGRAPAVQTAHQTQIALLDVNQHGPGYGHAQTSAGRLTRGSIDSAHGPGKPLTRVLQWRANSASSRKVTRVTTGTSRAIGLKSRVQGRS